MSGIGGIFYLDGRPVERDEVERLLDTVAHRGPDRWGVWCEGPIGMGHRMLWTTPESLRESQPLSHQSSGLVLTADARIDNRDQLLAALGFSDLPGKVVSDSELILAAYEKWAEDCPKKLVGDFAFAIWDQRRQRLFCARDHFGVKPLVYYCRPGRVFVFGSEAKAVLAGPQVHRRLNQLRVGHHLAMTPWHPTITFYQDIFRLPAAHCMTVTPEGIRIWRYWSLDPCRELRLGSDVAYAEAFREIFTEAVRCRLRSAFPVASTLSGGLDSSAVTCVARDLLLQSGSLPLRTISMVYDDVPESDESPFINTVLAQGGFDPHYVHPDRLSPLCHLDLIARHEDEPYPSPTVYLYWEMCREAAGHGARIILDGLDGDTCVSHGDEYLADLGRRGQWAEYAAVTRAVSAVTNGPHSQLNLKRYGLPSLSELASQARLVSFARGVNQLSRLYGLSRWQLVKEYGVKPVVPRPLRRVWRVLRRRNGSAKPLRGHIVDQEFAQRVGLAESVADLGRHLKTPPASAREEHYRHVSVGLIPYTFEMNDRAAAAFGLEARHPFYDKRLVEFCLALPADQKLQEGWGRSILRRALAGVLPPEVQWRPGKASNSAAFTHSFLTFEGHRIAEVVASSARTMGEYVDVLALKAAYHRYISGESGSGGRDEMLVWVALTLALWLDQTSLTSGQLGKGEGGAKRETDLVPQAD